MPPVTQALLITNVAVFLLQSVTGDLLEAWFALWPIGYGFGVWQLLTYGFLHGGPAHIFFNMFALYMFGSDIERLFGARYFLAYYLACVVSAALCQLVGTEAGVAHFAHLGGMLGGWLVIQYRRRGFPFTPPR